MIIKFVNIMHASTIHLSKVLAMCIDLALETYIQPPLHEDSDVHEKRQFAPKEGSLELEKD